MKRRGLFFSFVAATAGCSLVVSLDDLGGGDAGVDAQLDVASDAPADATPPLDAGPMCDPTKPFTTVRALTEIDTPRTENHASLSPDELQIWFSSDRSSDAGTRDIFTATRAQRTDPFGPATVVNELSMPAIDEAQPWISTDLLTVAYGRQVNSNWDLFIATRQTSDAAFGSPGAIVAVNTTAVEWMPAFSSDGGTIYFVSDREGGTDLWSWQYGSSVLPARIVELNSASTDQRPCISADSLWIYWSSNRTDIVGGKGALEIFSAHRANAQDQFSGIALATELSTNANEDPDWISPDLCRLYFHSNRTSGKGGDDIFVAERNP